MPAKILIGVSLDADESKELINWAIKVLAHPGDTIVAFHVIGATPTNKKASNARKKENMERQSAREHQKQFLQAKSSLISIVGELVKTCQSNEVNLEARVGINSSACRGLIEEAKTMTADYLVIGSKCNKPNRSERKSFITSWSKNISSTRATTTISNYCCNNVPDGCSLVLVPENEVLQQEFDGESSCRLWSENNSYTGNSFSSDLDMKPEKPSPRSVLDICSSNSRETISSTNTSLMVATQVNGKQEFRKPKSPFQSISSLFRMSYYLSIGKQNKKQQPLLTCFSYQEIASATNDFHIENLVGQGGYSDVYKGELANGCGIAVKRLAKDNNNANKEKEFLVELGVIGHVDHPNTAKLLGYCFDNGLYLIFKFYPNGTLSSALHGHASKGLDWPIRFRIILGIAKGLHYLHKGCKRRIIHRDIKASNVLLGPDYDPQISDFGLAKWLPSKWSHHAVIPIEGTFGYLAPEYFMHGIVDEKTDVFAFGILILEIVTGRRPVDPNRQNLLLWARPLMESGNLSELADPKLEGRYDMDQLFRVILTASYCVTQSSTWRPYMTEVLELLKYGQESEVGRIGWRIPKFTSDEMDDYSMTFGYPLPSDLTIDDI